MILTKIPTQSQKYRENLQTRNLETLDLFL